MRGVALGVALGVPATMPVADGALSVAAGPVRAADTALKPLSPSDVLLTACVTRDMTGSAPPPPTAVAPVEADPAPAPVPAPAGANDVSGVACVDCSILVGDDGDGDDGGVVVDTVTLPGTRCHWYCSGGGDEEEEGVADQLWGGTPK